jgi:hypothetical protein
VRGGIGLEREELQWGGVQGEGSRGIVVRGGGSCRRNRRGKEAV